MGITNDLHGHETSKHRNQVQSQASVSLSDMLSSLVYVVSGVRRRNLTIVILISLQSKSLRTNVPNRSYSSGTPKRANISKTPRKQSSTKASSLKN
jgi:hypothetical protein